MPSPSYSLVMTINPKPINVDFKQPPQKICHHTLFQDPVLNCSRVAPISQILASAILLLPILKVKVNLSLWWSNTPQSRIHCLLTHHAMNTHWSSGGIAPCIPNLFVVSFVAVSFIHSVTIGQLIQKSKERDTQTARWSHKSTPLPRKLS
jgi:hypothetical protein